MRWLVFLATANGLQLIVGGRAIEVPTSFNAVVDMWAQPKELPKPPKDPSLAEWQRKQKRSKHNLKVRTDQDDDCDVKPPVSPMSSSQQTLYERQSCSLK